MLGDRLLRLRNEAGLTQEELGKHLNINKFSISSYERGINEPSDQIKIQIARFFHVTVDYLVGMTDNPIPYDEQNSISLPRGLPDEARLEIHDFIQYLRFKYKVTK